MNNYDTIRLEKGMYAGGRSLTRTLEALDPSENYKGSTPFSGSLSASISVSAALAAT